MKAVFDQATIELVPDGKDYTAILGDGSTAVHIIHAGAGRLELLIAGKTFTVYLSSHGAKRWVTLNGQTFLLTRSSVGPRSRHAHHPPGELTAPMPGQIRSVNVREGETVGKGQTLMLLEAMKMEIRIQAPREGVVKSLKVTEGQTVEREQLLLMLEDG